jgi:3D (Asp-Asp-Asp) domain-containing protein
MRSRAGNRNDVFGKFYTAVWPGGTTRVMGLEPVRNIAVYPILLVSLFASGCVSMSSEPFRTLPPSPVAHTVPSIPSAPKSRPSTVGVASWYGPGFEGLRTASGETFHAREMTAASSVVPLGSVVKVTNLSNGRAVRVRINDCGPFIHGRKIDLSRRAADKLALTKAGTKKVRIEILDRPLGLRRCARSAETIGESNDVRL